MISRTLLAFCILLSTSVFAQTEEKQQYFGLYRNVDTGAEYFAMSMVRPLYSMKAFIRDSRKQDYYVKCAGTVFYNKRGQIVEFLYAGEYAGIYNKDAEAMKSLADFIKNHPLLFSEELKIGAYTPTKIEEIEIREDVRSLAFAVASNSDREFRSPSSGQSVPRNLYLSMMATHILAKIKHSEVTFKDICEHYAVKYEEVKGFLDELSDSLGYMDETQLKKGIKTFSMLMALDVIVDSFDTKIIPAKTILENPKRKNKRYKRDRKPKLEVQAEQASKVSNEFVAEGNIYSTVRTEGLKEMIKERIYSYCEKNAPHLMSSLYGKNLERLLKFAILSQIPNMEKRNFKMDPDLLELLFGTEKNNWSDGVIALSASVVHPTLLQLLALRLIGNGPNRVWMYDPDYRKDIVCLPFEKFLGKPGVSQRIIVQAAEDVVANTSSVREANLYKRTSDRLVNIKNGFWSNFDHRATLSENKAVSLMKGYLGHNSGDVYELLQEVLKVMAQNIEGSIYFGEKEFDLWFNEGLYDYLIEYNKSLEDSNPYKEDIEFTILAVSSLVFYSNSVNPGAPIITRNAFMKIIYAKQELGFGNDHFMEVFNSKLNSYNIVGAKQFPALIAKGYYGLIKY